MLNGFAAAAFIVLTAATAFGQSASTNLVAQGQYIFALSGGCACHSEPKSKEYNSGARGFPIPLGTVYSTNLTSDKETGLGSWTDQQIIDAIIKGVPLVCHRINF